MDLERTCFCPPPPAATTAARMLNEAVYAHEAGDIVAASGLIRDSNMPELRAWLESIWGAQSPYLNYRHIPNAPALIAARLRTKSRMPTAERKRQLVERDGYHCRFCGIPLIRMEIRKRMRAIYPEALPWGKTNLSQHAAFQAMWLQYDHIIPHSRGGDDDLDNLIVTCAACNFGRMQYLLSEVGLADPRRRKPIRSSWDGLERFGPRATGSTDNRRAHDQISVVDEYGNQSNAFLDDLITDESYSEEAADLWNSLVKLGLTGAEASAVSGFTPRRSVRK